MFTDNIYKVAAYFVALVALLCLLSSCESDNGGLASGSGDSDLSDKDTGDTSDGDIETDGDRDLDAEQKPKLGMVRKNWMPRAMRKIKMKMKMKTKITATSMRMET